MAAAKAHGRLCKIVGEEACEVAVPGLHPGKDALSRGKLASEFFDVRIYLLLVDDEGALFGVEFEEPPADFAIGKRFGTVIKGIIRLVSMVLFERSRE